MLLPEEGEPGVGEEGAGVAVDVSVVGADEDGVAAADGLDHGALGEQAKAIVALPGEDLDVVHGEVGLAGGVGGEG